jgi:hypothetical protein
VTIAVEDGRLKFSFEAAPQPPSPAEPITA